MQKDLDYFNKNGSIPASLHPDTIKNLAIALGLAAGACILLWGIVRKL